MVRIVFYMEGNGRAPVKDWLFALDHRAQDKCMAKLLRLREEGHKLRRPEADLLGDGIHELRIVCAGNQYRILYFFHGREAVVLAHALIKKVRKVPRQEIETALRRKVRYETNPDRHTYGERI